jgi:hypothetical protein
MALGLGTSPEELAWASIKTSLDTLKRISRGQQTIFSTKIPDFIVFDHDALDKYGRPIRILG